MFPCSALHICVCEREVSDSQLKWREEVKVGTFQRGNGGTKGEICRNEKRSLDKWRKMLRLEFPVDKTKGNFIK